MILLSVLCIGKCILGTLAALGIGGVILTAGTAFAVSCAALLISLFA